MNGRLEKTGYDHKAHGLKNPETHVLTHNSFNTYLVLIFSDLNKTQICKKPYRDNLHQEIEKLLSFDYLNLFKPNEHTEEYYKIGQNDKSFLFEIEEKKSFYVGEKLFSDETTDEIVKYSSNDGLNGAKYTCAQGIENVYFMLYRKVISFEEYKN